MYIINGLILFTVGGVPIPESFWQSNIFFELDTMFFKFIKPQYSDQLVPFNKSLFLRAVTSLDTMYRDVVSTPFITDTLELFKLEEE